jgi:SAM-dependent methyltransferase
MCVACKTKINPAELDAVGDQIIDTFNKGAAALMISVGYRTGLFETMRLLPASTPAEIAHAAELNERYVREWLGAMTTAGFVSADAAGERFELKAAARAWLSEEEGAENLAHLAQYVSMLGSVEDKIVTCFKEGGGVPYAAYPRFDEVMATDSGQSVVGALFDHILPLVPGLIVGLKNGIRVLDVGCGRALALIAMAEQFPASEFVGYDLSAKAVEFARGEAERRGLTNLFFEQRDLTSFDKDAELDAFDLVTAFDAIHDQVRPDRVLVGIRRTLKGDGVFLMQDIGASSNIAENVEHPIGTLLYTISCMHCMTVSLAEKDGLGVGAMWGEQLTKEFLSEAGFGKIDRHTLEHDIQNYFYVVQG